MLVPGWVRLLVPMRHVYWIWVRESARRVDGALPDGAGGHAEDD